MSRIFLTGAFGNVGRHTLDQLLEQGHEVTCFDLSTRETKRCARPYQSRVKIVFGDITRYSDIVDHLSSNDAVIHLAAIIPPASERNPDLSQQVNFIGTKNIVKAMARHPRNGQLIFASSVSVYGRGQDPHTLRTLGDSLHASDNYTDAKIKSEGEIKAKLQNWTILRLGVIPPLLQLKFDPMMYELPLSTKIHFLHPKDAATAFVNCIDNDAVRQKTLLIGGDETCHMEYHTYLNRILRTLGTALPPDRCFTLAPYYSYWMDTMESQQLLCYQQHSFQDFIGEIAQKWGWRRGVVDYLSPFIERWMERKSSYGQ
ncbi:NAD(P)-dependent oxidoreductase [Candidatus Woesearchaeota archaeon]|nr:NAD(P)-dependent oxidoreductase [Candidatus Woesearchaeota archaeon]